MFKTALTTAIVLASASAALAFEFDPNPANRYPAYAAPIAQQQLQSAPVVLEGRNVALTGSQVIVSGTKTYDREGANHDGATSN